MDLKPGGSEKYGGGNILKQKLDKIKQKDKKKTHYFNGCGLFIIHFENSVQLCQLVEDGDKFEVKTIQTLAILNQYKLYNLVRSQYYQGILIVNTKTQMSNSSAQFLVFKLGKLLQEND